jgi:hypothetical protein
LRDDSQNKSKDDGKMKVRILRGLCFLGALLMIWGVFEPWLVFSGDIHHVSVGTFRVSGVVYGFGAGFLDSGASVTVWSGEYSSTDSTDFWFGLLPLAGGLLNLILAWRVKRITKHWIVPSVAAASCTLCVLGCALATVFYSPAVFTILGGIDGLPISGAYLYATDATVSIGVGPVLSLAAGLVSSVSCVMAKRAEDKRDEGQAKTTEPGSTIARALEDEKTRR